MSTSNRFASNVFFKGCLVYVSVAGHGVKGTN